MGKDVEKTALRHKILELRDALQPSDKAKKSALIINRAIGLPEYKRSDAVALFVSFGSEIATRQLIDVSIGSGKRVFVPAVDKERKKLSFGEVASYDDLKPGTYGILEPPTASCRSIFSVDLIFVPGVAFDPFGYRLGYGAGYYDRLLKKTKASQSTVGLAFEIQITDRVPASSHDIPVDKIVTEDRVIDCLGNRKGKPEWT